MSDTLGSSSRRPATAPSISRLSCTSKSKGKRIRRRVVLVPLMDELPIELLQLVLGFKADAIVDLATSEDSALQLRVARRDFLWRCTLVSKRWQAAAEPLLYADVCLRQLAPLNAQTTHLLSERGRYRSLHRAFAAKPARRDMVRSVEKDELGLNCMFIKQLPLFPNLRSLGTVVWPFYNDDKDRLVLATEDDWAFTRYCLDKDRARTQASIERTQYLAEYQQLGTFPKSTPLDSTPPCDGRPSVPKPPLQTLAMSVSSLAAEAHDNAPTLDEWFDLGPLRSLTVTGMAHPAIVPRAIMRAGITSLRELRLEGWSVNHLSSESVIAVLRVVGHNLRVLHLIPIEPAAFPAEVLSECPRLETLSLHALSGDAFADVLTIGSDSLQTIHLGTRRSIPSPEPGPPSALPFRLLSSLIVSAPVFPALRTVGFPALDFEQRYVRSSADTIKLGLAAAEKNWKVTDRHDECWQSVWASAAGEEWESVNAPA